jgi:hypothetical protein
MKTIEIIFLPNGQSRVETKGFVGAECREASKFLEHALGQCTNEQLTPEFHQQAEQQSGLHSRNP